MPPNLLFSLVSQTCDVGKNTRLKHFCAKKGARATPGSAYTIYGYAGQAHSHEGPQGHCFTSNDLFPKGFFRKLKKCSKCVIKKYDPVSLSAYAVVSPISSVHADTCLNGMELIE